MSTEGVRRYIGPKVWPIKASEMYIGRDKIENGVSEPPEVVGTIGAVRDRERSKPKKGRKNGGKRSEGIVFHTLGGNSGQALEVRDKKLREKAAEMARIGPGKFPETPTQYKVYCRNEIQVVQQEQNANQKEHKVERTLECRGLDKMNQDKYGKISKTKGKEQEDEGKQNNLGQNGSGANVGPKGKIRIVGRISGVDYKAKEKVDFGEAICNTTKVVPEGEEVKCEESPRWDRGIGARIVRGMADKGIGNNGVAEPPEVVGTIGAVRDCERR
ncbi:hypothetical protein BDP27DRAFT_1403848 [Rhodocollybia butyracea]|uniref:Uncharacterized protein n=1 Tax=Rhodocollybia butyracea TaxID=206335 RepID=A0A9P5PKM9_9AGAR|nr:hypothetical protein BDP27DRAFT_1403848 [Rhodocollybia butyracea]